MRPLLLISLSLLFGCQGSGVAIDYDTQTNFGEFTLYEWLETANEDVTPKQTPEAPLITQRVKKAISSELHNEGFVLASPTQPANVLVRYTIISEISNEEPKSSGSLGLGRSGANTGIGLSIRIPLGKESIKKNVTLFVDLLDAKDKQLKWRASKMLTFTDHTPEQISAAINKTIAAMFAVYPPIPKQK